MPSTDVDTSRTAPAEDNEKTLTLRLPRELLTSVTESPPSSASAATGLAATEPSAAAPSSASEEPAAAPPSVSAAPRTPPLPAGPVPGTPFSDSPLARIAAWPPAPTSAGDFRLAPVRLDHDLPLIARWMNDPAVAAFWELAGPDDVTRRHLRGRLDEGGSCAPCLGLLDGRPMSYWELYRADLDPLAAHYPARPHDIGVHLLIGGAADRGRGLGGTLLRAVAGLVLDRYPSCPRLIAEPDVRNTPSVAAFRAAGFREAGELGLPDKRAVLMILDRVIQLPPVTFADAVRHSQ